MLAIALFTTDLRPGIRGVGAGVLAEYTIDMKNQIVGCP